MRRPSAHHITPQFNRDLGGAIPANLLVQGNNDATGSYMAACQERGIKPHPARYPLGIPSFFIQLCTEPGDLVLDPFAGSNPAGYAAQGLGRRWIAIELNESYLQGSLLRFGGDVSVQDGPEVFTMKSFFPREDEEAVQSSLFCETAGGASPS